MDGIGEKIGAFIAAIIGLAVVAIVISNNANTANVLSAFFGGVSNLIGVAISPITGQSVSNLYGGGLTGGTWGGAATSSGTSGFSIGGLFGSGGAIGGVNLNLSGSALSSIGSNLGGLFGSSGGSSDGGSFDTGSGFSSGAGSAVSDIGSFLD